MSRGTLRRKLFFKKIFTVSLLFRSLTGKKFSFPACFFRQVWKNCISRLNRYILRRRFQKKVLYVIFGQQSKTFGCRISFLRVPTWHLNVVFSKKKWKFFNIMVHWASFFSFLSKDFQQDCPSRDVRFHKKKWKENNLLKNIYVFYCFSDMSQKIFLAFWRNFFGRVVQTAFDLSVGSFSEFFWQKKSDTFYHSSTLSKHFTAFSWKFSSRVVRRNYLSFYYRPDIERKSFALLTKKMQQGCQNCFLSVYRNSLNGIIFSKILNFFYLFRTWAKKFWLSVNFRSIGLSKVYYINPKEQLDEKYILGK